jgi:hypothetical protein
MIHPRDLTPESLRDALDRLLRRDPPKANSSYEGGTERAAEILTQLARSTGAQPCTSMAVPIR